MSTHTRKKTKAQGTQTWRSVLPGIHPAADLLPRMSESELRELGEDIKRRGLQSPVSIFIDADGVEQLLDGISRLDAMETAELPVVKDGTILDPDTVPTHIVSGNVDPFAYVLSANIHRRHLTNEQKSAVIEKLLKANPKVSNRIIAKQVKADHKTVGKLRKRLESTGDVPQLDKTTGADGKERKAKKPSSAKPKAKAIEKRPNRKAVDESIDAPEGNASTNIIEEITSENSMLALERMEKTWSETTWQDVRSIHDISGRLKSLADLLRHNAEQLSEAMTHKPALVH